MLVRFGLKHLVTECKSFKQMMCRNIVLFLGFIRSLPGIYQVTCDLVQELKPKRWTWWTQHWGGTGSRMALYQDEERWRNELKDSTVVKTWIWHSHGCSVKTVVKDTWHPLHSCSPSSKQHPLSFLTSPICKWCPEPQSSELLKLKRRDALSALVSAVKQSEMEASSCLSKWL